MPPAPPIRLSFFCELPPAEIDALLQPPLLQQLARRGAALRVALLDRHPLRLAALRRAHEHGVPVHGWLLAPEAGYWLHADNAAAAHEEARRTLDLHGAGELPIRSIGLDFEPDRARVERWFRPWRAPAHGRPRIDAARLARAEADYRALIALVREAGLAVESYLLPPMADERLAGSDALRRWTGLVDVEVDREIWMLYSSFMEPFGHAALVSYAANAPQLIRSTNATVGLALGSTGGGVDIGPLRERLLDETRLLRDAALASRISSELHIFSLEGCVARGLLTPLLSWPADPAALQELARGRGLLIDATPPRRWALDALRATAQRVLSGFTASPPPTPPASRSAPPASAGRPPPPTGPRPDATADG